MYPVMLSLRNRPCLVVGGGGVAARKIEGLRRDGATVTVVAPEPIASIEELAACGEIDLRRRSYESDDLVGFVLVFAATDDRALNQRVAAEAVARGTWVNVADDPELCTFHLPARVQRGALQLAVASAGEAPFVVRRLRQLLERRFGPEWAEWIEAAARFRVAVRAADLSHREREKAFDIFFRASVDGTAVRARVPTAAEQSAWLLEARESPDARESSEPAVASEVDRPRVAGERVGLVSLVGAGPGDAGLLTVRGRARLLAADAIVYDRLASTAIPCELPSTVDLHCVGKTPGRHPVPQEEINALLVRLALRGKRVVRLKGGDPYVFGRGGEEAEALGEAGIPFEVVPSVSAAVAVPAYAGIPVTHRGEVVRITMVTAHEATKEAGPQVRWDLLAQDPHTTLLGYMGVTSLPNVVARLLEGGMDPSTPAAMIERGTTSRQRVVRTDLADLPAAVEREGLRPPALFVIGPTVRHAESLDWFGNRPLLGERMGLARSACAGGGRLADALESSGVELVEVPLPLTPAARVVIGALRLTGWVFRSADEVEALEEERDGPGWSPEVVAWCLEPAAAERARERGWRFVEEGPLEPENLVEAIVARRRSR